MGHDHQSHAGTSNSVTDSSGSIIQARDVYGGIHLGRFRPKPVSLCATLATVLLITLCCFSFFRPTSIRVLSPVHGASVNRCVPVIVEGRTGLGRGLVVGVYAPAQDVVYLSRVLDGNTTDSPLAVGSQDDRPGTAYDIVVLSAPTAFLDELRQAAAPRAFTAHALAEQDATRETKINVVRKGPGPVRC
ncbi:hypothetical protein [Saccharothrix sp. Mg75]|uniref:hypothetical protein n=1 Tax=Saccharothrix sp. Mg75 TaxID=3445357 RepID=UPI003EEC5ABE